MIGIVVFFFLYFLHDEKDFVSFVIAGSWESPTQVFSEYMLLLLVVFPHQDIYFST
jgi:hypothetical protein